MRRFLLVSILCFLALALPVVSFAKVGVGIGTGKIEVTQNLKPGTIYTLPPLTVINTGDTPSDYKVTISYDQGQTQIKPGASWFSFSPDGFHLDPGAAQIVNINLNLPVKTVPGSYFSYLEADPVATVQSKTTSIGVAAAAKLYFTVSPANFFEGVYYRVLSLWKLYMPWSKWGAILIAALVVLALGRRFLNVQVNVKRSTKQPEPEDEETNSDE